MNNYLKGYMGKEAEEFLLRDFSPQELENISREEGKVFRKPRFLTSPEDPIEGRLVDPVKRSIILSLLYAIPGSVGGYTIGNALGGSVGGVAGALTGLGLSGLSGLSLYKADKRRNRNYKKLMQMLPEGSTLGDMETLQTYQRALEDQSRLGPSVLRALHGYYAPVNATAQYL